MMENGKWEMENGRSRNMTRRFLQHLPFTICLFPLLCAGCAVLGVAAYKLSPPPTIDPVYIGLENQSVGVMVWADRAIRIDWPTLQLDLANSVQTKFQEDQKKKKEGAALVGTTFPVLPASIVRYQKDHPEIEAMAITDVAPKLGVTRLIYIEMEEFSTRSEQTMSLFRGMAKATVKVIEVTPDGAARVAHEVNNVAAVFPPKSPPEGIPAAGDARIYAGTIDAFATEIVHLYVPYQEEE
jgi:hypothetical protein